MLLTDEEAATIRREVDSGTRGPVLLKWVRQLLEDREERIAKADDDALDALEAQIRNEP